MRKFSIVIDDGIRPKETHDLELVDTQAARIEAARLLGMMIAHEPEGFWGEMDWSLTVKDEAGMRLFRIHALAVEPSSPRRGPPVERI